MRRRPLAYRVAAVLLAALLSLTGSGASIAHGIAHIREHRAADHHGGVDHHGVDARAALADVAHDDAHHDDAHHDDAHHDDAHHDDAHHDDHDVARAPVVPVIDATPGAPGFGAPAEPATHPHARLDALVVTRLAIAAFLPAMPVLVPAAPVIAATAAVPPAPAPLERAEPPTGPPPPSRAPPLG